MIPGDVIYLDVDGPLLDVSERYHVLHRELVRARGGRPLERDAYWACKRERRAERDLLRDTGLAADACADIERARLEHIEGAPLLLHDRLWPWTLATLGELAGLATLVLVTQRGDEALCRAQLDRLGILAHVAALVAGRGDGSLTAKAGTIRGAGVDAAGRAVLVGDTEVDVESARALRIPALAVRSGIRSDARLLAHGPDALLDDLRGVAPWLRARGWEPR